MSRKKAILTGYKLKKGRETIEELRPDANGEVEISRVKLPLRNTVELARLAHGLGLKLVPIYTRN